MCNFWEIFNKPSVETCMSQKTPHTFNRDGWSKSLYDFKLCSINLYPLFWDMMSQYYTFFHHKVTFFPIYHNIIKFTSSENLDQVTQTPIKGVTNQWKVIHKNLNSVLYHIREYKHHTYVDMAYALDNPKVILLNANVLYGQLKVVLSWSFKTIDIWL